MSITLWFFALLPQIHENWRRKSTDGLSTQFLALWVVGDSMNVIGCIILNQKPFQLFLGSYFVVTDIVLFVQYFMYRSSSPQIPALDGLDSSMAGTAAASKSSSETDLLLASTGGDASGYSSTSTAALGTANANKQHSSGGGAEGVPRQKRIWERTSARMALVVCAVVLILWILANRWRIHTRADLEIFGFAMAWASTIFYHASRLPQLWLNHKRQSVEGLSLAMFAIIFSANGTYAASLLVLLPVAEPGFLYTSVSFIYGAVGSMLLDILVLLQFCHFNSRQKQAALAFGAVPSPA
ncbi:hypothetical protein GQ54DRAFT_295076 [Martensiomyces pterosporus]|nr:hypothetical protein GQ54DRAFT_295076 [Martensiomyces pterosporus]